jgi:hypothetical protein
VVAPSASVATICSRRPGPAARGARTEIRMRPVWQRAMSCRLGCRKLAAQSVPPLASRSVRPREPSSRSRRVAGSSSVTPRAMIHSVTRDLARMGPVPRTRGGRCATVGAAPCAGDETEAPGCCAAGGATGAGRAASACSGSTRSSAAGGTGITPVSTASPSQRIPSDSLSASQVVARSRCAQLVEAGRDVPSEAAFGVGSIRVGAVGKRQQHTAVGERGERTVRAVGCRSVTLAPAMPAPVASSTTCPLGSM